MTKLPNDTVLRLAAKVSARIMHDHETQEEKLCFPVGAVHEFAVLIQADLEKVDTEVADAHDLLDRHQIPRQTSLGIPLSLMGRIALAITGDAK